MVKVDKAVMGENKDVGKAKVSYEHVQPLIRAVAGKSQTPDQT